MPPVDLILSPYDSGQRGIRMGAGPSHLLELGLLPALEDAGCRARTALVEVEDVYPAELARGFALHARIADRAHAARSRGALPVVLAGNCNAGVIGCLAAAGRVGARTGLVWCDAHGDFQTPETDPDGFLDSMGLAMVTGRCWTGILGGLEGFAPLPGRQVVLLGARDFDPGEREALADAGITVLPGNEGDLAGRAVRALRDVAGRSDEVHLHLDADAHDAACGRANEWAEPGGPDVAAYLALVHAVLRECAVASVSVASYDPAADRDGAIGRSLIELVLACAAGAR